MTDEEGLEQARRRLAEAAARLSAAAVPDEAVADLQRASRRLGVPRRARLRPVGRAWRLGVLLLAADGTVRATGAVTRAVPPGHPGHVAVSAEERRELRAAAFRGPFPAGATVHVDAPVIELTAAALSSGAGPLLLRDGVVRVRWSVSAGDDAARELGAYLEERVGLLIDPPQGAS